MFLHGAGERGNNLEDLKKQGLPKMIAKGKSFDFIIVSPQCPKDLWWPEQTDVLIALLDEIEAKYHVDTDRVYLTGLSMGGFGTWTLAAEYPNRFAAIAPICGGSERISGSRLKKVPVWAFHGAKDNTVPLVRSQEMVDAVKRAGGDAKLTIYPDAEHDSWTEAYNIAGTLPVVLVTQDKRQEKITSCQWIGKAQNNYGIRLQPARSAASRRRRRSLRV